MNRSLRWLGALGCVLAGCTGTPSHTSVSSTPPHAQEEAGLLVMAHGGGPEWNRAVEEAVAPLRMRLPTALALGMADPVTLQAALDSLAGRGVRRVAVVRLFLSGASFLHRTEFLLGLRSDPPASPMEDHGDHDGQPLRALRHTMDVALGTDGLGGSPVAPRVMGDRVRAAAARSADPPRVLLLAHGMGTEADNDQLLQEMAAAADAIREAGASDVEVATLREDWPEERARAEVHIRSWVGGAPGGRTTVVVPFRLFGFGPYAQVLDGLEYQSTEGLLPHDLVSRWIESQARALLCRGGRTSPLGSCEAAAAIP